jgi:hypothetical protein
MIGNSHVAALKTAWNNSRPKLHAGFSLSFFAVQKAMFRHIALQDRVLVPEHDDVAAQLQARSDGLDRVEIDRYDAIVMVGSGFGIDLPDMRSLCGTLDQQRFMQVDHLVSQACFDAALEQSLEESPAIALIDRIRTVSEMPILMVPTPYFSERLLQSDEGRAQFPLTDRAALARCVARARASAERVAASHGCEVLWQDESTVAAPGFTRLAFNHGALVFNLPGARKGYDDRHGNEDFGRLAMSQVLGRLDAISRGRVLADTPERQSRRSG